MKIFLPLCRAIQPASFVILFIGIPAISFAQSPDKDTIKGEPADAANIFLSPVAQQLKAAAVTAKSPVIKNRMDKLIFNPANDLTSQGGVALDLLKKVPMVSVDIDGNVELQGNANIRFLINGKPSGIFGAGLADALQAIPASQIQRIEVITSPGAKYDAAGTAGIINIVLKDSRIRGVNGNINLSAGTRLENGSVNMNARTDHWGMNAFFSGNDQLSSNTLNTAGRESFNAGRDTICRLYQNGSSPFVRNGYQSGFSIVWSITPLDELTATLGFDHTGNHGTGTTAQDQQTLLSSGYFLSDMIGTRNSAARFSESAADWSLAYKKIFKKEGQELDVLYTSSYGRNRTDASQVSQYPDAGHATGGLRSANPGRDNETDLSLDYTQPIAQGFIIETGAKAVLENINNNVKTDTLSGNGGYLPDPGQTYSFNFTRNIYAAYLSASFSVFHDFLSAKAGIRYERTGSHSDFSKTNIPGYDLWTPSFLIRHKLNETQSVKFAYTYRVERPDYEDLNPFLNIGDPNNISTGNPLLKTEIGHKFELGYDRSLANGGAIYVGGFYNYNTNDIQLFTTFYPVYLANGVDYKNVSLSQRVNIGSQTTFGANIFGSVSITDQLSLRSNTLFREQTNSMPGLASIRGFSCRISFNSTYQFAHDLAAEAFGNFNSSRTNFQNTRPAFLFYTFAVRKQILHKKVSLGLTTTNPFSQYVNQRATAYGDNFIQSDIRLIPLRSFGFTVSYKFGKLDTKKDAKQQDNDPPIPSL